MRSASASASWRALFEKAARTGDDKAFMRTDREFNELCLAAVKNEFAAGAMGLMNSLSRRFWFHHYKQAADMPETAKLHADIARAIGEGDEAEARGRGRPAARQHPGLYQGDAERLICQ